MTIRSYRGFSLSSFFASVAMIAALLVAVSGCDSEPADDAENQPAQESVENDSSADTEADSPEDQVVDQSGEQDDSDPGTSDSERIADREVVGVEESEQRSITATTTDVSEGESLQREHVERRELPADFLPADPLLWEDLSDYVGRELDTDLSENNIVVTDHFRDPDEDSSSSNRDEEIMIQR